jgi:hypothetical protein
MTEPTNTQRARRLRLPSPAMVVACLAFLVATAGAGTAATVLITGKQVKDGSLTGVDVKNRSLGAIDLTAAAVATLKGQAGPAGAKGDKGDAGPSETFAAARGNVSPPTLAANATVTIATRAGLGVGKYVILARTEFDDVSGSPKNVTCRLEAGGATDDALVGVPGVVAGGSASCTLILAVDLAAAGSAVLKVVTPGGSSVRVGDAKVIAIRVGSLDLNNVTG